GIASLRQPLRPPPGGDLSGQKQRLFHHRALGWRKRPRTHRKLPQKGLACGARALLRGQRRRGSDAPPLQ
ncbi:unnamed protein product, partial [Ascophyllum nodosum]